MRISFKSFNQKSTIHVHGPLWTVYGGTAPQEGPPVRNGVRLMLLVMLHAIAILVRVGNDPISSIALHDCSLLSKLS